MNYIGKLTDEQILRILQRIIHILYFTIPLTLVLVCCSCSTTKPLTTVVEHTARDTLYISNVQYDSIYINQWQYLDRSTDTIYLEKVKQEFRYKYLHDTIRVVRIDSIPVIKEVEVIHAERYIPWYAQALSWVGAITTLIIIVYIIIKIKL